LITSPTRTTGGNDLALQLDLRGVVRRQVGLLHIHITDAQGAACSHRSRLLADDCGKRRTTPSKISSIRKLTSLPTSGWGTTATGSPVFASPALPEELICGRLGWVIHRRGWAELPKAVAGTLRQAAHPFHADIIPHKRR